MTWLQFVQNAAAHLMSDTRRYDHISAVLHQLHWIPVSKRVDFKTATLVYHSLSSMAAAYLAQTVAVVWSSAVLWWLKDLCLEADYSNFVATSVSRLPVQVFGTAFQLVLGKWTSAMSSLKGN